MLTIDDIRSAANTIQPYVHRTPVFTSSSLDRLTGCKLFFKAECLQKTGSFKVRGAANKIAPLAGQDIGGVGTLSSGNHGQAVAYMAGKLGIPAVILVPDHTSEAKISGARAYGAEVIVGGDLNNVEEIMTRAFAIAEERRLVPIFPFDDLLIMAGQGTIGLELMEDLGKFDAVIIPVGGGGLLSGLATAIKLSDPSVKVYGVGPQGACSMFESFHQGKPVALNEMPLTLAEALRSPFVGTHCLEHALKYVDDVVTVSDAEIIEAMNLAWSRLKLVVEPGGASSLAAITAKKIGIPAGKKVVCIFSGGNVDLRKLSDIFK